MKCPACGTESSGNFCPSCGSPLDSASCTSCGSSLVPGARFCTQCGAPTARARAAGASSGSNLPWYIGAAVLTAIIIILALPLVTGNEPDGAARAPMAGAAASAPPGSGTPPPLTGTPREQADRLFDRIMRARSAGDTASVAFFAPMGIQAYEAVRPLDNDGLFHLAMIHNAAGSYDAARAAADQILDSHPDHLLGLAIAAEAALGAGDEAAAREYFGHYIDVYDVEIERDLPEYLDHAPILPEYLSAARSLTAR